MIDRHHSVEYSGSTTSLVRNRSDLVQATVAPSRLSAEPYTIVLHEFPDLDCVASAYLAISLVTWGNLPNGYDMLARYVARLTGSPIAGWTSYPPLSTTAIAGPGEGVGQDLWLGSIALFAIGQNPDFHF